MRGFLPVSEEELMVVNGRGGDSGSSESSSPSTPSPTGLSSLERGRVNAAVSAREVAAAKSLVAAKVPYGASNNVVGQVNSPQAASFDCTGAMSAVTGLPYQTTASLMDPAVQASAGYVQAAGNKQVGTWTVVRYQDPDTGAMVGHAQMTMGNGTYFDSVGKLGPNSRSGPSLTKVSTQEYLEKNGVKVTAVYLRPKQ